MKKLFFAIIPAAFFLQACEGPAGPPGPAGADGLIGEVHEVTVTFTSANNYRADFDFDPVIPSSDKVIGFILEGEDNLGNDNWEPLPQTFFHNGNTYLYLFDFSRAGFTLHLKGNANPGLLAASQRTNRVFRMLIVPAALINQVDINNMHDIMAKMGAKESDINVIY